MQKKYLLVFLVLIIIPLKAHCQTDCLNERALKLKENYLKSFSKDSIIFQNEFFQEFPNCFFEVQELYGNLSSPVYNESYNHLEKLFFKLNTINDTIYFQKLVNTSIGGHWDADGINIYQNGVRRKAYHNPALLAYVLKNKPNADIRSFFYFLFDGIHTSDKKIPQSLLMIKKFDKRLYHIMESTFLNVCADNEL